MENLTILNLPFVIKKMLANEIIKRLQTELKKLSKKSQHSIEINNYYEKRNFSDLILHNFGIYLLINGLMNKFYVGKSENLTIRLQDHRNRLFDDSHGNPELQKDFNEFKEL